MGSRLTQPAVAIASSFLLAGLISAGAAFGQDAGEQKKTPARVESRQTPETKQKSKTEELPPGEAKKPVSQEDSDFLITALRHASPAIRSRAAQRLTEEKVDALPRLVDEVTRASDLRATRAGLVLIDRLVSLRRKAEKKPEKSGGATTPARNEPVRLELQPADREQLQRIAAIVQDPRTEPWRFYLAVYLLDKVDPTAMPDLRGALAAAIEQGHPMKQYAAVQALHRRSKEARDVEGSLWNALARRPCNWRGLFIARRVLDDDAVAFTDEVVVRDVFHGVTASFANPELLILETLRISGAPHDRLIGPLLQLAGHESQDVRLDAARQLSQLDGYAKSVAAEVLVRMLREPGSLLRQMMGDESQDVRKETTQLFQRLGPAALAAVPALSALLSARENRVRITVAETLGEIGVDAASAANALEQALRFERLREGDDYKVIEAALRRVRGEEEQSPQKGPDKK